MEEDLKLVKAKSSETEDKKRDINKYGFLSFAYQALNTAQKVLQQKDDSNESVKLWHEHPTDSENDLIKSWVKKLYTSCFLHKDRRDQGAIDYRLELMYEIDEYLSIHHSMRGHSCISVIDILLFSLVRREMKMNLKKMGPVPSILEFTYQL